MQGLKHFQRLFGADWQEVLADFSENGLTIGDYIASGANGAVFKCSMEHSSELAVKFGASLVEAEKQAAIKCGELGLGPKIHGVGAVKDIGFIVMDEMKITLERAIIKEGIDSLEEPLFFLAKQCFANNLFHGDLWNHCNNVMVGGDGRLYVVDFGFAKLGLGSSAMIACEWALLFMRCGFGWRKAYEMIMLYRNIVWKEQGIALAAAVAAERH